MLYATIILDFDPSKTGVIILTFDMQSVDLAKNIIVALLNIPRQDFKVMEAIRITLGYL